MYARIGHWITCILDMSTLTRILHLLQYQIGGDGSGTMIRPAPHGLEPLALHAARCTSAFAQAASEHVAFLCEGSKDMSATLGHP